MTATDDRSRLAATEIEVGTPVGFGGTPAPEVLRLAALGAAPGEPDVLDQAVIADAMLRGLGERPQDVRYEPPRDDAPWSLAEVHVGGQQWQIARGEPRVLVERLVKPSATTRARAISEAARFSVTAYRPLGVAYRSPDEPWRLAGYLPVRGWSEPGRFTGGRPFDYHLVWDVWLRLSHWTWVASIVVLTVSGYFLAQPQWVPVGYTGEPTGYFIGYTRLVHYIAAVVLMLVLLVRVWNLTTSRVSYDRWKSLIPFRRRRDMTNGWRTAKAYAFVQPHDAPLYFGHNPLQQLTYTSVYLILLLQVATGLALWGLFDPQNAFFGLFTWINEAIGTQQVRLLHYMIMWGLLVFIPAHVYLSVRADGVERMGAISSMVSGGRWVRRGAVFEDWPNPDGGNSPAGAAVATPVAGDDTPGPTP
jgi:Ni/Fe-hydrogenase b-type cytochrome subunit